MTAVACVYAAFGLIAAGLFGLVRPSGWLRRPRAGLIALTGLVAVALGLRLPAPEQRAVPARTRLDEFLPVYQFSELHTTRVRATPAQVVRAVREVTADEILLFRTLTYVRRLGRPGPESILNAPERMPLLEVATRTSFLRLAEEADREIVIGTLVLAPRELRPKQQPTPADFQRLSAPGFAKAAMNFRVEQDGNGGSLLSTETRVLATDAASCRRFAAYWRVIYPGSALIRRMWLRAIRLRAETTSPTPAGAAPSAGDGPARGFDPERHARRARGPGRHTVDNVH
jgi:hypothetical protein